MKQSIPPVPTSAIRSLILRPSFKKGGSQRIANLILHTLRSYPLMMLRDNTLPPFIHPHIIYSEKEDDKSCMEPLVNCISLVHMISKNHKGSRKLFWKNVRMECERVFAELKEMDKWARLAAMQALSIYILIRLDEGETEDNNLDFLLLTTVAAIAREIMCSDVGDDITVSTALHDHSTNANWKEWLFLESRQRLAIVYRVVNMLVYFEPSTFCTLQSDLILAPLPSKKQLWESNDSVSWARERVREPHIYYALAASGDVVRLDEGQAFCAGAELLYKPLEVATPLRSPSSFEEWCAGMDGLGGLVMLAASLVG
ncbi:hypothetical protein EJ04DRAFT_450276 [Polyplosphaeria fusca]|uniref:Uncharacterized protein n=1 Tax=Polyplosphaeria fusca TaxID=682080 RepID=A0A9P4UV81_9PLEO|nr:hypothetical protein EJ04DRAFT_450276 [Polyplosphaeria fusca]